MEYSTVGGVEWVNWNGGVEQSRVGGVECSTVDGVEWVNWSGGVEQSTVGGVEYSGWSRVQ